MEMYRNMMHQERDLISPLEEIRQRLERLENQHWERAIEKIDLGQIAIDLRRARIGSFPDEYCTGNIWDVLLELYEAKRSGEKRRLAEISANTKIPEKLSLRYIDVLSADGFLYQEEDLNDCGQPHILLTNKAVTQIDQLFGHIRVRIGGLTGLSDSADNDTGIVINQSEQTG